MDPIGMIVGIAVFGLAHFGTDADTRYEAKCWSSTAWYRCHQENFANIHTDAYKAAVRAGHNIRIKR